MSNRQFQLDYDIVNTLAGLERIEAEWNELWEASKDAFVTYSYPVTRALIAFPLRRRREKFWCITGRRNRKLLLVWPFVIYRHFGWRMASAIADTIDYSDPLMDESLDKRLYIADAIRKVLERCPCDLVQFQFIRKSSVLSDLVPGNPGCVSTYTTDIPQAIFNGTWEDYEKSLSKSQRAGFTRKRNNLFAIDGVKFEVLPCAGIGDVLTWMIPRKNSWLSEVHKRDETHMSSANIISFLTAVFRELGAQGRCRIFAITRGAELIAVDLCMVGKNCIQWYIGTYSKDYAKYSPGMVLKQFITQVAYEDGLDYDMLRGFGRHKSFFANFIDYATTYRIPRTLRGRLYTYLRAALKKYRVIR